VTPQRGEVTQHSDQVALPQSHDPAKKTVALPDATWASTSPEEPGSQLVSFPIRMCRVPTLHLLSCFVVAALGWAVNKTRIRTAGFETRSQLSVTFDHQGAPSYITLLLLPVFPSSPSSLLLSSPYMYDQARVRWHKKQRALETDTVLIAQRGRRVSLRLLL
jgi:hypothetical protein